MAVVTAEPHPALVSAEPRRSGAAIQKPPTKAMDMTMSHHQFASITAGLLARKGDAAPSLDTLPARPAILTTAAIAPAASPRPAPAKPATAPRPRKSNRRVSLALGEEEYERLGIAAAKHHETRPQILRAALKEYLDRLACSHGCSCIVPPATRTDAAGTARRPVAVGL